MFRQLVFLLSLCSVFLSLEAQENDFRSWYSVELSGEAFNLIDFALTPELRLENNSSQIDGWLGEVDACIPLTKYLRIGINYRYQLYYNQDRSTGMTNRFGLFGELDKKVDRFHLAYRAMYLQEYSDIRTTELGNISVGMQRHKISAKYRGKGWDITPGVSAEVFIINKPEWMKNETKIRLSAGIQYKLNKKVDLGLGYKYQCELFENNPLVSHILTLGLEYQL